MFKKICIFGIFALVLVSALNISADLQDQLDHIKTQMFAIKRAWNSARIRIKIAEKAAPNVYYSTKNTLEKVISGTAFTTKLDFIVSDNVDSIVNRNMSFASIKQEFNVSDFFPNITMNTFGKNLFSAMAQKEYCGTLGRKLAQKMQELKLAISSQQTMMNY